MVNAQNNRYSNAVDTICQKIFWFASLCLVFCTFAPKTLKTLTCDYCSFFPQNCRSNDTLAELCFGHNSVSLKITRLFGNSEIFCASSDSVWYALTYAIVNAFFLLKLDWGTPPSRLYLFASGPESLMFWKVKKSQDVSTQVGLKETFRVFIPFRVWRSMMHSRDKPVKQKY